MNESQSKYFVLKGLITNYLMYEIQFYGNAYNININILKCYYGQINAI